MRSLVGSSRDSKLVGMTLIELLFVMGLIALLFGAGLGAFSSLNVGDKAARATLEATLRAANNWAIARNAPSTVRIDALAGTFSAEGMSVVGTWRFEDLPVEGAFDFIGSKKGGAEIDEDGYRGSALSFVGAPANSRIRIDVHKDTAFQFKGGFAVSVVVRQDLDGGGQIFDLDETVNLQVTDRGAVRAAFMTAVVDEFQDERDTGRATLVTEDGLVRKGLWTAIAVFYDREFLTIHIDGLEVARLAQDGPVRTIAGPLMLGASGSPFQGAIDDLVMSAVAVEEVFALPESVIFGKKTPKIIQFQAGGGLNRRAHHEPVDVPIVFEDGREDVIRVNLYGAVE